MNFDCFGELDIFTDGSRFGESVGLSFVVYYYGIEIDYSKIKLEKFNSVFQAELAAIYFAIKWIKKNLSKSYSIVVYSDCLSGLQALKSYDCNNSLVMDIKCLYKEIEGLHDIKFRWVKSHVGIEGNERADVLAKEATLDVSGECSVVQPSRKMVITRIKQYYIDLWYDNWNNSNRRKEYAYYLKPMFNKSISCHLDFNQIVTGHGRFPVYLKRFGIQENEYCHNCGVVGS
ncbi:ribonuclease H-like, partial [Stegodyphus dumicola]|uniref:ribonuclease H-like n=1 Tax=Stegodyphus dumicola TaxID=202533 RepID=UPI0015AFA3E1